MHKGIATTIALLLAAALHGEDYAGLMEATRSAWPDRNHLGVICDYRFSAGEVAVLAASAGADRTITVVDVRNPGEALATARNVRDLKVDCLVLLLHDPLVRDGGVTGTQVVRRVAFEGVPSLGTTRAALVQGAAFAMGEGTGGQLLVTDTLIGTVGVSLPNGVVWGRRTSDLRFPGTAEVRVLAARR